MNIEVTEELIQKFLKQTEDHIKEVRYGLNQVESQLTVRGMNHDQSKYSVEELPSMAFFGAKIKEHKFGSEGYENVRQAMKPALDHHYSHNSHHPEHYSNGIAGMCLLDLIEMLADWRAAAIRSGNVLTMESMEAAKKRFNIDDQLFSILCNTANKLDWLEE